MKQFIPAIQSPEKPDRTVASYVQSTFAPSGIWAPSRNTCPVRLPDGSWGITQRPTFTSQTTTTDSSGNGLGVFNWSGVIVQTFYNKQHSGNHTVQYFTTAIDLGGVVGGTTSKTSFAVVPDATYADRPYAHFPGGTTLGTQYGSVYRVNGTGGVTEITDADMPGNNSNHTCGGLIFLDGYLFVGEQSGRIHNSALNDPFTWAATDFVTASRENDTLVHIAKQGDHIAALGSSTIEFFYNAGNPSASPLSPRQDLMYNVGCIGPNWVTDHNGVVHFIGSAPTGEVGLYRLENMQLTKVFSPQLDNILQSLDPSTLYASNTGTADAFQGIQDSAALINIPHSGPTYVITLQEDNTGVTLAVHLETGIVSRWEVGTSPTYTDGAFFSNTFNMVDSTFSSGIPSDDNIVMFSNSISGTYGPAGYGDLNETIFVAGGTDPEVCFYTNYVDFGTTDRKRCNSMEVIHYPTVDDAEDPSNFELDWYDSDTLLTSGMDVTGSSVDSAMFTGGRTVDLSTFHNKIYRCGTFRQRMLKGIITKGKRQLVRGVVVDVDLIE